MSDIFMNAAPYSLLGQDPPSSKIPCYTTSHLKQLTLQNTLGSHFRFNRHIDNIRKNASRTLHFLKRNLRISSSEVKTQAYQSYVWPRLEYAASVWDPFTKSNKDKLEMDQRCSAHCTLGRYHNRSSVPNMLNHLGRHSLEMRYVCVCVWQWCTRWAMDW